MSLTPPLAAACPPSRIRTRTRTCVRKIDFESAGQHVGITLANTTRFGNDVGVRVLRLDANDRAFTCGVCVGDVITHINGIRVLSHSDAILVIQRATEIGASMELTILKYHRSKWSACTPQCYDSLYC